MRANHFSEPSIPTAELLIFGSILYPTFAFSEQQQNEIVYRHTCLWRNVLLELRYEPLQERWLSLSGLDRIPFVHDDERGADLARAELLRHSRDDVGRRSGLRCREHVRRYA